MTEIAMCLERKRPHAIGLRVLRGIAVKFGFHLRATLFAGVAFFAVQNAVFAETLAGALSAAYHNNSTLEAERARQRGTDELVPQALAGWRPTISAQGSVAHELRDAPNLFGNRTYSVTNPGSLSIQLTQPIFRGFKTVEGTAQAEANVRAGRQQLLSVEQTTLFNAVQAYMNVIQAREILSLRRKNVSVLQSQLDASSARFKAGELTRTDVAQSRATLSGAQGQVALAVANVQSAEANYKTVIGRSPGKLVMPKLASRPKSLQSAFQIAQETNPNILAAAQVQLAAEHNVNVIGGDLLPTINLQASASISGDLSDANSGVTTGLIQGVVSVPIYEAGRVYSGVRQAKEVVSQNRIQVISAVRSVRESVVNAWNNIIATGQNLSAARAQVEASNLALDGVRQEYQVGSRSTIDVLNTQQLVVNAQISVVVARHDQLIASYQLLAAMGHLTSAHLGINGRYDVKEHYNDVRNKWIGLEAESGETH
jgi:outer membrane protein